MIIYKAQGQPLEEVNIDLRENFFILTVSYMFLF
jgi:hypothetical protein